MEGKFGGGERKRETQTAQRSNKHNRLEFEIILIQLEMFSVLGTVNVFDGRLQTGRVRGREHGRRRVSYTLSSFLRRHMTYKSTRISEKAHIMTWKLSPVKLETRRMTVFCVVDV